MSRSSVSRESSPLMGEIAKGLLVFALLVFLMVWLAGGFVDKVKPGPPVSGPEVPKLTTVKVERRVFPLILEHIGTVRSQNEAQVSSRIMAQVKEILVKEGDVIAVIPGESSQEIILARLDDRDILARSRQSEQQLSAMEKALEVAEAKLEAARAQVAAAGANMEKSHWDYRRYQDLYRHQAATGQQLQHMKAQKETAEAQALAAKRETEAAEHDMARIRSQREQARAALAEARIQLTHATVRAPFSGRVLKKLVNVGDMASPGQPLFVMDTVAHPEIHAYLTESLLQRIQVGQEVEVRVDALNRDFVGTLREIVPKSDPRSRTLLVKVSLDPCPDLANGLFARLRINQGTYDTLVVPAHSVREVGQLYLVDVLAQDGHPRRRHITLGNAHGDLVEVLSGLRENEQVVLP